MEVRRSVEGSFSSSHIGFEFLNNVRSASRRLLGPSVSMSFRRPSPRLAELATMATAAIAEVVKRMLLLVAVVLKVNDDEFRLIQSDNDY
jgi:hypothetical protein